MHVLRNTSNWSKGWLVSQGRKMRVNLDSAVHSKYRKVIKLNLKMGAPKVSFSGVLGQSWFHIVKVCNLLGFTQEIATVK